MGAAWELHAMCESAFSASLEHRNCGNHSLLRDIKDFLSVFPTFTSDFGEIRVRLRNLEVSRILAQDKRLYFLSVIDKMICMLVPGNRMTFRK